MTFLTRNSLEVCHGHLLQYTTNNSQYKILDTYGTDIQISLDTGRVIWVSKTMVRRYFS